MVLQSGVSRIMYLSQSAAPPESICIHLIFKPLSTCIPRSYREVGRVLRALNGL